MTIAQMDPAVALADLQASKPDKVTIVLLSGDMDRAMAAFIIDRKFQSAAAYALAGAVLSFFGFIHGAQLGVAVSPLVALGYVLFALVCLWAGMAHKEARG